MIGNLTTVLVKSTRPDSMEYFLSVPNHTNSLTPSGTPCLPLQVCMLNYSNDFVIFPLGRFITSWQPSPHYRQSKQYIVMYLGSLQD